MAQSEKSQDATILDEALSSLAGQLAENPADIRKRKDVEQVLDLLEKGVLVKVKIERPRFVTRLKPEDLGLQNTSKAGEIINQYFQLGRRSLLPKELQDELNRVESNARYTLERFSLESHWGRFVPVTNYQKWKETNAVHQQAFFALRDRVVSEYEKLVKEVLAAYRPVAEDAWRRSRLPIEQEQTDRKQLRELLHNLRQTDGREEFVQAYLARIEQEIPDPASLRDRFVYEVELGYVPLPSVLARDLKVADSIYKERALKDEAYRTTITRERAAQEKAEAEVWAERQAQQARLAGQMQIDTARTQAELELVQLQRKMDEDILQQARQQKQKLVDEFYGGVVAKINSMIYEVCINVGNSIERNEGRITGSIARQLRNLIDDLEGWNFTGEQEISRQIEQLKAVIPPVVTSGEKRTRIDTTRVSRVVEQLGREAAATLIDLGHSPVQRTMRQSSSSETRQSGIARSRRSVEEQGVTTPRVVRSQPRQQM